MNFNLPESHLIRVASSLLLRLSSHIQQSSIRLINHSCSLIAKLLIHFIILLEARSDSPFALFLEVFNIDCLLHGGPTCQNSQCTVSACGNWGQSFGKLHLPPCWGFLRSPPCCTFGYSLCLLLFFYESIRVAIHLNFHRVHTRCICARCQSLQWGRSGWTA